MELVRALAAVQNTSVIPNVFLVTLLTSLGLETFKSTTGWQPWTAVAKDGGDQFSFKGSVRSGAWVQDTKGEVWPKPKFQKSHPGFFALKSSSFKIKISSPATHRHCDILSAAVARFPQRIFPPAAGDDNLDLSPTQRKKQRRQSRKSLHADAQFKGYLKSVEIVMNDKDGCEKYPHLDMDENYEIKINSPSQPGLAVIRAASVWGLLRGLETFSQLIYPSSQYGDGVDFLLAGTEIRDGPRFPHRGVLLDTSRHFITKNVIKDNLDLMEMNKYNVFHWHMTDDPSFPYVSKKFPNLSAEGSWHPRKAVYTQDDVAEIIEFARLRGIRVLSEFDTPGHTQSFEPGQPGILTECYDDNGNKNGHYGPMDPSNEEIYDFIEEFFGEITEVFPERYLHLGGDEVDFKCWKSNPEILKYMRQINIEGNFRKLESVYIKKLLDIVSSYPTNNGYIVWQEVFDNGVEVKNDTIIHVWKGEWERELADVTRQGLRTILSSPWYLNYISYGSDWTKYYLAEPLDWPGSQAQKDLVLGGETCMWDEHVNTINLTPRLWARASAVGERLWSAREVRDSQQAAPRLQEMECRMLRRGYQVAPVNGPAYCPVDWSKT